MKKAGFYLVAVATVIIGLLVGTLNSAPVQLDLLWIQFDLPLGLAVLLGFAAGLLIGLLMLYLGRIVPLQVKLRRTRAKLARQDSQDQNTEND